MNIKPHSEEIISAFLCLRFKHLSLNSLGFSYSSEASQAAIAITHQQQIFDLNKTSLASGVELGMSISHALLINPSLELHHRDEQLERQKLQELSHWAYRFTSLVSQHSDHILILEVGKSCKLFKSFSIAQLKQP